MLRIMEMSARWKLGDRYSRLNNLRKTLEISGIQRWCYPNAAGFSKLFLSETDRQKNWKPNFDATLSKADRTAEITRGDKRLTRMLEFIDDLQENERFFLSEHINYLLHSDSIHNFRLH